MKSLNFILLITLGILFMGCHNSGDNVTPDVTPATTVIASGEQLFKINCAQCHRPSEDFTGPALKNVSLKWKNKDMLYEFVNHPQDVIAKDPYAKALFAKWNQAFMQPFPDLTHPEVDSILQYCNTAQ